MKFPKLLHIKDDNGNPAYSGYDYDELIAYLGDNSVDFNNWFTGKTGGLDKGRFIVYQLDWDKYIRRPQHKL